MLLRCGLPGRSHGFSHIIARRPTSLLTIALRCRQATRLLATLQQEADASNTSSDEAIRQIRIEKAQQLRQAGKEPYAFKFARTHLAARLQEEHKDLPNGSAAEIAEPVAVAGRVRARRVMGKLAFVSIEDDSGKIQLYVDKKQLEATSPGSFADLKTYLDIGDIVGVHGGIRRTDKGELSVTATSVEILTKSLLPLPEKWHGLSDAEKRFRQRYVDMIVTEGVRDKLRARAKMTSTIRRVLEDRGFLEVETPVLENSAGGADARPFITYHNALQQQFALRIATELHLKRLVIGGLERVFEIGRIFRNEGISARHNPEFTSVELYQAYGDYYDMMDIAEDLIRASANAVLGTLQVEYQGQTLDFESPFRRATMHQLVHQATGVDFESETDVQSAKEAAEAALRALEDVDDHDTAFSGIRQASSIGEIVNLCFEAAVETTLQQPTFVTDHPVEVSPLAKAHRSKPGVVERFELYIAGRELANAFSELNDPVEQRARFQQQLDARRKTAGVRPVDGSEGNGASNGAGSADAEEEPYEVTMDEDFLTALEIGLPPTGGMGIGIDRLCMLLTDSASIREVIAFPLMRAQ